MQGKLSDELPGKDTGRKDRVKNRPICIVASLLTFSTRCKHFDPTSQLQSPINWQGEAMRFSKRLKFGPVNINLSGSGVGASFGVRGARVGVDAKGKAYSSLGIPGTGLSQRTYHGTVSRAPVSVTSKSVAKTCACGQILPSGTAYCTACGQRIPSTIGSFVRFCVIAFAILFALFVLFLKS